MMPVTETWVRMLPTLSSVANEGLAAAKKPERQISVRKGAMLRICERSRTAILRGRFAVRGRDCRAVTGPHLRLLTPLPAGGPC